jgi:DNA-binding winged helix-turn-helix (wHTH) protein/Tol biopolymer transport system component
MSHATSLLYRFGDFAIDVDQRVLLSHNKPVSLTPKVFDTLLVLIEHRGRIIEKDELMNRLWPDTFVEESNLTFNIKQLRKALGDDARRPLYIETVARRGYRFVAEVEEISAAVSQVQNRISVGDNGLNSINVNRLVSASENLVRAESFSQGVTAPQSIQSTVPPGRLKSRTYLVWSSLCLVLIGGLVVFWWLNARMSAPLMPLKVERLTSNGKTKAAAISADGKFIAYVIDEESQQSLRLKNIVTGSDIEILPAAVGVALSSVTFSPDDNHVYYRAAQALYQIPVLGGTPKKVLQEFGGRSANSSLTFSPDGRQIALIRYSTELNESAAIVIANTDGTNERILATSRRPTLFRRSLDWSPDGSVIACATTTGEGPQEVVTVQVSSGVVSSIPSARWDNISQVAWRADGRALYVVAAELDHEFQAQIWQLSYPSGGSRNLTNDSNIYEGISLTADGRTLIAVRLQQVAHIWLMPSEDSGQARQLTSGFDKYDGTHALGWLTDDQILYGSAPGGRGEIWRIDDAGHNAKQVATHAVSTTASSNGKYLVFQNEDADGFGLFRFDVNDGEKRRLTKGTDLWPTFSPDGTWVVFTRWAEQVALWKVPMEGGEAIKITSIPGYALAPAVSPDGKLVAFFWGGITSPKIGVVSFQGGEIIKAFDVPVQYFMSYSKATVEWTRDGKAIHYIALQNGASNIWLQPMDGSSPNQVTTFPAGRIFNFAFSPDGLRLALSRGTFERDAVLIRNPS